MFGYAGKVLEIDLAAGTLREIPLDRELARATIGGSGLAAHLYLDRMGAPPYAGPLDASAPLIVMTGPMAGHPLPGSSRFVLCARSPQTGFWGEDSCGGFFAPALKAAGYDGLIITGAATAPVYLLVEAGGTELRDASGLWGGDTYATDDALKALHGATARTLSIGPAGENLVRYAAVIHDKGHAAGRTGMGAVMGSKRLKAVVATGRGKPGVATPSALKPLRDAVLAKQQENLTSQTLQIYGTAGSMYLGSLVGDVPFRNWSRGTWDDEAMQALDGTAMEETILTGTGTCHSCTVSCKREVAVPDEPHRVTEGPGPEYETVAAFGSMTLVPDLKAIAAANDRCNRYGLDTISCGATIAFAIEATERGLLESSLSWGNAAEILETVDAIAFRRGLGDLLAEGSARAAARIGPDAAELAITVKGLELPMHSPRAYHGLGIGYATAPRGACHNAANVYLEMGGVLYPELGLKDAWSEQSSVGKALVSAVGQDYACVQNAACFCLLNNLNFTVAELVEALSAVTGFPFTVEEIAQTGERLWQLKRGINSLLGAAAADDCLPPRLLLPLEDGPTVGSVPDMALMLREFYALRDLDAEGRPSRARLQQLGLHALADALEAQANQGP
jgi:aldehyde:ferredoxin oxidoreductase